jgi:hypothetical protein
MKFILIIVNLLSILSNPCYLSTKTREQPIEQTLLMSTTQPIEQTLLMSATQPLILKPSTTQPIEQTLILKPSGIPITNGNSATLTEFNDITTQCYGTQIPDGNGMAINPLLLGYTVKEWIDIYMNANPMDIPWCGKHMNISVNGKIFKGLIIDTCSPTDTSFIGPDGVKIGGMCGYKNDIDLYSGGTSDGINYLSSISDGDDFFQGQVDWIIY